MLIRLNKLLASRGIGARRRCDVLIAEGRVRVNGRVVSEAGTTVEEGKDRIEVDGHLVPGRQKLVYYVLNKPVGVITTLDDPEGRSSVRELLPRGARVYPVGRLDADTSGLLLLTNDGELAHKLMHPSYGVTKTYRVRLAGEPTRGQLTRLERGVEFERGVVSAPAKARRIDPGFDAIMIEVQIHEGRFRQVRRMCEKVGLVVTGLHRVGYGPLRLGPMAKGVFRELSAEEVERLQAATQNPVRRGAWRSKTDRPAKPAATAPGKPARPAAAKRELQPPVPEDDDDVDETWVPGGGFTREFDDDDDASSVWPLRPEGRRGDADFSGPAAPKPKPARSARPATAQRGERTAPASRSARPAPAPAPRGERPAFAPRRESPARFTRSERPAPAPRGERPARFERSERPASKGRGPRPSRPASGEQPGPSPRGKRTSSFVRSGRQAPAGKGGRPSAFARFEQPKRQSREDRRAGMERGGRSAPPSRADRPRRSEPSEAPSRADRSFRSVGPGRPAKSGSSASRGKPARAGRAPASRGPSSGERRAFSPSGPRPGGSGRQSGPPKGRSGGAPARRDGGRRGQR
jgi:pseudouridine synthase